MMTLEEKKIFLKWLMEKLSLKQRESYWILSYLMNHDVILNRVIFVEQAELTPRGLIISDKDVPGEGISFFKEGHIFYDPEQIFHDIRMNWRETLYLEIKFPGRYKYVLYQNVLEENPFIDIQETLSPVMFEKLDDYFLKQSHKYQLSEVENKLNEALEAGDMEVFNELSKEFMTLKKNHIH